MVRRSLFLEEVYRDCFDLMAGGGAYEKAAEALRLLGAGIAGGLCSTGSVYLELMGRCPAGGQPVFAGIWEVWKLLVTGFLMIWIRTFRETDQRLGKKRNASADRGVFLDESFEVAREGTGSPGLIRRDFAEWAGDSAGAVFSYRLEKSVFMGFFCMGVRFLAVALVRAADDRENTVSGPSFLNEKSKEFTAMADSGNRLLEL